MAAVPSKLRAHVIRTRVVAVVVAAGLLTIYGFFAIRFQPLGSGADEWLYRAPGQTTLANSCPAYCPGPGQRAPLLLLSYVDGAEASLVKALYNQGPTQITITGVEISPFYLTGALVTLKEAQPAAIEGPPPCSSEAVERGAASLGSCQLDQAATWSGGAFRPIQVSPGKQGLVAVHLWMSHCEDNGPGGAEIIDSIQVHYNVLGLPHMQAVDVGPYWFQSPDACPRSGPARP
jgi:hypothetical protein